MKFFTTTVLNPASLPMMASSCDPNHLATKSSCRHYCLPCASSSWKLRVSMTAAALFFVLFVIVSLHCVSRVECLNFGAISAGRHEPEHLQDEQDDDAILTADYVGDQLPVSMMSTTAKIMPADKVNNNGSTDADGDDVHEVLSRRKPTLDERQQAEWTMLARENVFQMRSDSIRCATPRARVIKVQDVHPQANKRFVPSCIVLHRCDREAGCCDDVESVCSAVQKQRVPAHFYVVSLGQHNGVTSVEINGRVERLRFTNHTQCGCRRKRIRLPPNFGDDDESSTPMPSDRAVIGAAASAHDISRVLCWMMVSISIGLRCSSRMTR